MASQRLLLLCVLIFIAGCAPTTRYAWNNYDNNLYQHYKNPTEYDKFIEQLKETIEEGEESGRVPPGIYAEYGFAMYEKGNFPESIKYFKLENDKWPESRVLMAKMIQYAEMRGKKAKLPSQATIPAIPEQVDTTISEAKGAAK